MGLEVIRQLHYLVSEHWAGYHRCWTKTLFGRLDRAIRRKFSDWTRSRIARVLKILFFIGLYAVIAGRILETSPVVAIFEAPAILWQVLPFVLQLAFAFRPDGCAFVKPEARSRGRQLVGADVRRPNGSSTLFQLHQLGLGDQVLRPQWASDSW